MLSKFAKNLVLFSIFSSVIGVSQLSKLQAKSFTEDSTSKAYQKEQLDISKKIPTMGFRNAAADIAFLRFLQYFGSEKERKVTGYDMSPDYLSISINRDPFYRDFYLFLSESTTFYAAMPERTVALMEEGLSKIEDNRLPDSYYIWRYKGTDELLFLGDGEEAQKSFEKAAIWASQSSEENSSFMARLSKQTAEFLASDPDSAQAKISSWSSVLSTSLNNDTRDKAIEKIRELGGEVIIGDDGGISVEYSSKARENNVSEDSDIEGEYARF